MTQIGVLLQAASGETWDMSELVTNVEFEDNINRAGVVTCEMLNTGLIPTPAEGNILRLAKDGVDWFVGYVFRVGRTKAAAVSVTAYDQLRYLKTKETYVFDNLTASDVVRRICADFQLQTGDIQDTRYRLGSRIFDAQELLDIISECLTDTLVATRDLYFLKDNAGRVELKHVSTAVTSLVIDPEHLLYDYKYDRSIDSDTFNQIKLARDNPDTGSRELYVAKDSSTIRAWGQLQHYEVLDDNVNAAQAKARADALLQAKNRVLESMSVEVLGDKSLRAGNMVYVELPVAGVKGYLLCKSAKHSFTHVVHTASAEFKLV